MAENPTFMTLLIRAQGDLNAYVAAMLPFHAGDVADVVQETNLALVAAQARYKPELPFMPWAITFAKHQVQAYLRDHGRERVLFSSEMVDRLSDSYLGNQPSSATDSELGERLRICRGKLKERDQRLVSAFYDQHMRVKEIARQMDLQEQSVRWSLGEARKKLGSCIRRLCHLSDAGIEPKPRKGLDAVLDAAFEGGTVPERALRRAGEELCALDAEGVQEVVDQLRVDALLRGPAIRAAHAAAVPPRRSVFRRLAAAAGILLLFGLALFATVRVVENVNTTAQTTVPVPSVSVSLSSNAQENAIMNPFTNTLAAVASAMALSTTASATTFQFADPFSSGAVLQRDIAAPVWGTAAARASVTVKVILESTKVVKGTYAATADTNGAWQVALDKFAYGGPYTVTATSGSETLSLTNVLFGDVWLCTGQSNMEMGRTTSHGGLTDAGGNLDIKTNSFTNIRILDVPTITRGQSQTSFYSNVVWHAATPGEAVDKFSACGYLFGMALHRAHPEIPIGLVGANVSGTKICAWMPRSAWARQSAYIAGQMETYEATYALWREAGWSNDNYSDYLQNIAGAKVANTNGAAVTANAQTNTYDDSAWSTMTLPGLYTNTTYRFEGGTLWLRRTVTLTAAQAAAANVTFSLDTLAATRSAYMTVYVNGRKVFTLNAASGDAACSKTVKVSDTAFTAGDNLIVLSVPYASGVGGFYGDASGFNLSFTGGTSVSLAGSWKYYAYPMVVTAYNYDQPAGDQVGAYYYSMIAPLEPMAVKGCIWYQGEFNANSQEAPSYENVYRLLLEDWRAKFTSADGCFPSYLVQIASTYTTHASPTDSWWAAIRWAETRIGETVTNCATACIIDANPQENGQGPLHPHDKKTPAERLARLALASTYGDSITQPGSPVPLLATNTASGLVISFLRGSEGLTTTNGSSSAALLGFQVEHNAAGAFTWAKSAMITNGTEVFVADDSPSTVTRVRFAWDDYPVRNLVNGAGLPCGSFELTNGVAAFAGAALAPSTNTTPVVTNEPPAVVTNDTTSGVVTKTSTTIIGGCTTNPASYRAAMALLIADLKAYANRTNTSFQLLTNGGTAIYAADATHGYTPSALSNVYESVSGILFEDYFYGYDADGTLTSSSAEGRNFQADVTNYIAAAIARHYPVLSLDYTGKAPAKELDSYAKNNAIGFIGFAADDRELRDIPATATNRLNLAAVTSLASVSNYVAMLSTESYEDLKNTPKAHYLAALKACTNDLLVIDISAPPVYGDNDNVDTSVDADYESGLLTAADVTSLKTKPNGARRQVFCYMSVGEAEDYRPYWKPAWTNAATYATWIAALNPDWPGDFKVKYWRPEWRDILYGHTDSQLDLILARGFDGVFLDVIDAFEYFEDAAVAATNTNTTVVVVSDTLTNIWTGASGTDWSTAGNWSAGVPAVNQFVFIPGNKTVVLSGVAATVAALTIGQTSIASDASNSTLVITNGATLTVNGTVAVGVVDTAAAGQSASSNTLMVAAGSTLVSSNLYVSVAGLNSHDCLENRLVVDGGSLTNWSQFYVAKAGAGQWSYATGFFEMRHGARATIAGNTTTFFIGTYGKEAGVVVDDDCTLTGPYLTVAAKKGASSPYLVVSNGVADLYFIKFDAGSRGEVSGAQGRITALGNGASFNVGAMFDYHVPEVIWTAAPLQMKNLTCATNVLITVDASQAAFEKGTVAVPLLQLTSAPTAVNLGNFTNNLTWTLPGKRWTAELAYDADAKLLALELTAPARSGFVIRIM